MHSYRSFHATHQHNADTSPLLCKLPCSNLAKLLADNPHVINQGKTFSCTSTTGKKLQSTIHTTNPCQVKTWSLLNCWNFATLNDLERHNSPYFAFFHGIRQIFRPIMVEDRPIMSVKYCLPVPVFYFWRKL